MSFNSNKPNTYAGLQQTIDYLAYCDDADIRDAILNGRINIARYSGVGGNQVREIKTAYDATLTEKVIGGPTNSFIILGKDRFAGRDSGYGGVGATGCAAIDIVAGHMGTRPIEKIKNIYIKSGKDFKNDAARIYLSQMCDIDEYFDIPKFQTKIKGRIIDLEVIRGSSGIAAKADNVRLIARETIKIVTIHSTTNSLGNDSVKGGIDIIAGINAAKLNTDPFLQPQPMVKGDNLVECLKEILAKIDKLADLVSDFMETQSKINVSLASHTHMIMQAGGLATTPIADSTGILNVLATIERIAKLIENAVGTKFTEATYFTSVSPKYINSAYNRVN